MKIVVDSSVWIAGIGSSKGFASEVIFKSYKNPETEIFISDQILDEITKNLIEKIKFNENSAFRARVAVRNLCDYGIGISSKDTKNIKNSIHQKDNHILALCEKVQADFLVTFDRKHLLPLKKFGKTQILEPKDFILGSTNATNYEQI